MMMMIIIIISKYFECLWPHLYLSSTPKWIWRLFIPQEFVNRIISGRYLSAPQRSQDIWAWDSIQVPTQCRDAMPGFFFSLERNFLFPNVIYSENGFWFSFCTGCPVLQSIHSHFISPTFSCPLILITWGADTHFERNHLPYKKKYYIVSFP